MKKGVLETTPREEIQPCKAGGADKHATSRAVMAAARPGPGSGPFSTTTLSAVRSDPWSRRKRPCLPASCAIPMLGGPSLELGARESRWGRGIPNELV